MPKSNFSFLLIAALPLLLCGAQGCPPSPTPPTPVRDSGPLPYDGSGLDSCGKAEANLLALGCKDNRGRLIGGPNLHGVPWAQVCRDNAANGVDMKPDCIAIQATCAEVDRCR